MEEKPRTEKAFAASSIRFGPFVLDPRSAELRKNNLNIRLQDQPFQILLALLERPGEVVLREEIRQKLWPNNTVVEFDHSINAAIKRLRDALRDSAEEPRYIETLPRRGYRFIAQVEAAASEPAELVRNQPLASVVPVGLADHTSRLRIPSARALVPATVAFLIVTALAIAWYQRTASARWARKVALPEAARLVSAGNYPAAFSLLLRSRQVIPTDPTLNRILREISHPCSIRTTPPGANVFIKPYGDLDGPWLTIGQSPIENFLLPFGYYRWRITKAGFRTVEGGAGPQSPVFDFNLDPEGAGPAEMIHVPRGNFPLFSFNVRSESPMLSGATLDDYWMDKYEVTNRQFKEFVTQGGYKNRRYWREEFVKDGRVLSWEQAMAEFLDVTGRPGPSTWEVGDYPAGHDDFPVNGVSWYEAAAYAEFARKQIPTAYHWYRAAGLGIWSDILQFSNFDGSGPVRAGIRSGIGPFGTYDMAGNVREWCWNATGSRRYILGGAWNDRRYMYGAPNAVSAFDRSPTNGFRCAKYRGALPDALTRPVAYGSRDYRTERPVSERLYRILQSFYSYDRSELGAVRESVDESSPYWRAERITFNAAYSHQRVIAFLYLPKNIGPPYQTVIFFPPSSSYFLARIDDADQKMIEFLVKSGRAVLFPIYQGTYERRAAGPPSLSGERNRIIEQCKDLRRSIEYLEARSDVKSDQLGYYGLSEGARLGSILLAGENRIRAAVLVEGGLSRQRRPPEIDEINFAPRVRIPVLMVNGRYDFLHPVETDQRPMFHLLGTPDNKKRYVLFDAGHFLTPQQDMKETLKWFDTYLGPPGR